MSEMRFQINVNVDAAAMSPEEAVAYCQAVIKGLTADDDVPAKVTVGPIKGLDKQLGRLLDHNPAFAPRVRTVHDELVKIGYVPTLPKSSKKELPSYISYIDPVTGENFGNLNSQKIYIMRGKLRDELAGLPHFGADSRYAHCHLTSDDAVEAVLKIADREKK